MEREQRGLFVRDTHESRTGHGFHGRPGYVASSRRLDQSPRGLIKIGGSPFATFVEAEEACNMGLKNLTRKD
jgi:hypothetical protein